MGMYFRQRFSRFVVLSVILLCVSCDSRKTGSENAGSRESQKGGPKTIHIVNLQELTERFVKDEPSERNQEVWGCAFEAQRTEVTLQAIIQDVDPAGATTEQVLYRSLFKLYKDEFGEELKQARGLLTFSFPVTVRRESEEDFELLFTSGVADRMLPNRLRLPMRILMDELVPVSDEEWVWSGVTSAGPSIDGDSSSRITVIPNSIDYSISYSPKGEGRDLNDQSSKQLRITLSVKFLDQRKDLVEQVKTIAGGKDVSRSAKLRFYEAGDLPVPDVKEDEESTIPVQGFSTSDGRIRIDNLAIPRGSGSMKLKVVEATSDETTYSLEMRHSGDKAILFSEEYKVPTDVYKSFFPVPASLWKAMHGSKSEEKYLGFLFVNEDALSKQD